MDFLTLFEMKLASSFKQNALKRTQQASTAVTDNST